MIKKYQDEYYSAINNCNSCGNSNEFIEFMLKMIDETLEKLLQESQNIKLENKLNRKIEELSNIERSVLCYIEERQLVNTVEIAKFIEKTDRTARRIIAKLEEKGLITWEGVNKNDPNIKYRLK